MKHILAIDDQDARHHLINKHHKDDAVTNVYNPEGACEILAAHGPCHYDIIYLDHDAGWGTFYPVACLIAACSQTWKQYGDVSEPEWPEVRVTSANPDGAKRMINLLKQMGITAYSMNVMSLEYYDD